MLTSTFPRWEGDKEPPFVFELCRRLGDRFDILVLAPHAQGARRFERIDGIDIVRFRYFIPRWERLAYQGGIVANLRQNRWRYLLLPLFFASQLFALWRILRNQHIDVIHAHWLIPQGLTVAIASEVVKDMPPVVCTSHGGDLLGLNGRLISPIKRWVIRCSSMLTVVSKTMADHALLQGANPEKLQTISMGVDTRTLFTPGQAIFRVDNEILFVGRLVEKKGISYLLDAMPEILRQYPDVRLRLVGSGPLEEVLRQQSDRLGIAHAVIFQGAVRNAEIPDMYRRATIFVAPSVITTQGDQEGLGLVLVEALACGCPVITTDLPAIRDVVIDGVTGLICHSKDSAEIARKAIVLLNDPAFRQTLARAGRQYVLEHFDWDIVADRYMRLIDDLAACS